MISAIINKAANITHQTPFSNFSTKNRVIPPAKNDRFERQAQPQPLFSGDPIIVFKKKIERLNKEIDEQNALLFAEKYKATKQWQPGRNYPTPVIPPAGVYTLKNNAPLPNYSYNRKDRLRTWLYMITDYFKTHPNPGGAETINIMSNLMKAEETIAHQERETVYSSSLQLKSSLFYKDTRKMTMGKAREDKTPLRKKQGESLVFLLEKYSPGIKKPHIFAFPSNKEYTFVNEKGAIWIQRTDKPLKTNNIEIDRKNMIFSLAVNGKNIWGEKQKEHAFIAPEWQINKQHPIGMVPVT